jgi:hypothetical protein
MAMVNEVEGSQWHREANVGVHTNMLLSWYKENLYANRNEKQRLLTMVSCLFHDVAKPPSRQEKWSETRGKYRSYAGHEPLSARMWINYAMENAEDVRDILCFDVVDIANVAFMIEHHLPFDMKKPGKRQALKMAMYRRMGEFGHRAWLDFLLSDQHGRISDDASAKLERVDTWMREWMEVPYE